MGKKRFTPACINLFYVLNYKYNYFLRAHKLGQDGSFYYTFERLAQETYVSAKTISNCVKRLESERKIRCVRGKWKKHPAKFWIISQKLEEVSGFGGDKPEKSSVEPENNSMKDDKNFHSNKLNNKENKENNDFSQVFKDQYFIDVLIKQMGIEAVRTEVAKGNFVLGEGVELRDGVS